MNANCTVQVDGNVTKAVAGDGVYTSPTIHLRPSATLFPYTTLFRSANNNATANGCNAANENVVVNKPSPAVTTNAGPDVVLGVNGSDLTEDRKRTRLNSSH